MTIEKTFMEWLETVDRERNADRERTANDYRPTVPVFSPNRPVLSPPLPNFKHRGLGTDSDPVQKPVHYSSGAVECIEAIEAATDGLSGFEGYCAGNAIKYVWRHSMKGGTQDLEKARWYIDRLISSRRIRGAK